MTTLIGPKLIENKFSGAARGYSQVLLKKLYRAAASKRKTIGWIASNLNLLSAVDRQPRSPRKLTRRESSSCLMMCFSMPFQTACAFWKAPGAVFVNVFSQP